jgi:hypothetical protein
VAGLHVWPLPASLESLNGLTLRNASPGGLIAGVVALMLVAFSLFAAVQVVRSPLKQRWLWVIVALLGFGKIGVAWKGGAVTQQWLAVQFFGAGMQRGGLLGPWWIYLSMPGGAFMALDRRRRAIVSQTKIESIAPILPPKATEPSTELPSATLEGRSETRTES